MHGHLASIRRFTGFRFAAVIGVALAAALLAPGCKREKGAKQPPPPVPVRVGTVAEKTMPVEISTFGNVEAISTITLKCQVAGELKTVNFTEGGIVARDQELFSVDRGPFEAAVRQAEGVLARDKALLENANLEARRAETLAKQGAMTQEQADNARSTAAAQAGLVAADQASLDNARLQLSYCTVRSAVVGCAGRIQTAVGNILKANESVVATVTQIEPIYVTFSIPELQLGEVRRSATEGRKLTVTAALLKDGGPVSIGELAFIDNAVDTATGTIKLRGVFANADHRLWPGQFVNVVLVLSRQPNAVVVPSYGVQTGQEGQFVFVVKDDSTAERRNVTVSRVIGEEAVIAEGLKAGERIVVDGQFRLVPGSKVEVKDGAKPAAASGVANAETKPKDTAKPGDPADAKR